MKSLKMPARRSRRAAAARISRAAVVMSGVSMLFLFTGLGGALAAPAGGGVKGDPQPELKPFKIGPTFSSGGSVAIESNGDLAVAYNAPGGEGQTAVCILARGSTKCTTRVTLTPLDGNGVFGVPQIFAPSADHLVVLQYSCCNSPADDDDSLYTSTDGGDTFSAPVGVGSLEVDAAALIGTSIVFGPDLNGTSSSTLVESIPLTASGPPGSTAAAIPKTAYDFGVGSYHGGALIASDNLTTDYTTYVAYARSGENFDASGSYQSVGAFTHEQLVGISGDALLTLQTTGKQNLELRLFNGTGFGPAHVVPGTRGGGPEWFAVDQDPSGRVHVFSSRGLAAKTYHLLEVSTSTGASWSAAVDLGNAINSNVFAPALDSHGSGLVLGTAADEPAYGYPVLATQSVTFSLRPATIRRGRKTTASGRGSPAGKGREVELQVERSGRWYTVATTHESASGSFTFRIKGRTAGAHTYRAVVSDLAGYLQYGYSAGRSLHVTS